MMRLLCAMFVAISLLSFEAMASFVLQGNFPEFLNQQFLNLTRLKESLSDATSGLLSLAASHIETSPGYRKPFAVNCSVFFHDKIDQVVCDVAFENVQDATTSCTASRQLSAANLEQLRKNHIFQMRTAVGLNPLEHPQVMYWLYFRLPHTVSASQVSTKSWFESFLETRSQSEIKTASLSLQDTVTASTTNFHSQTETLLASPNLSHESSTTSTYSHDSTETQSKSHITCLATTPPTTGLLAAWNQDGGTYADETNPASRYSISGGVVTDLLTGMQWGQVVSTVPMNLTSATLYCASQVTGGLTGWRVPNLLELQSLVDYTIVNAPYVDQAIFPAVPVNYLTSSTPNGSDIWSILFWENGCNNVATSAQVFCVRSCYQSPPPPSTRYLISDGVVIDRVTALVWQQKTTGGRMTQADGSLWCGNLSFGGFISVWRLPTVKELSTLIDYSVPQGNLMMDVQAFSGEPADYYLSSTKIASDLSQFWYVSFYYGYFGGSAIGTSYFARCVWSCSSPIIPTSTGVLAAWNQAGGTYADVTNQTSRYFISNGITTDALTGLQWEEMASSRRMNWTDAVAYCVNQRTGGVSGWRIPNLIELQTLVDFTISAPPLNATAFSGVDAADFWSSTPDAGNVVNFWNVYFSSYGFSNYDLVTTLERVRCVRSCYQTPFASRYMNGSGVVADTVTGLIWQQISTSGFMSQPRAMTHCGNLTLAGFTTGWRVPSIKELSTLVNYSIAQGSLMMNAETFSGEPPDWFWSSTALASQPAEALVVNFGTGVLGNNVVTAYYCVRCVWSCSTPIVPASVGLLAAWSQTGGTYDDTTSQAGRYSASNGVVTDTLTNMQWQQVASSATMNFTSAAAYCAMQNTGGLTGWRAPNIVELQTLTDFTSSTSPYLNATAFPSAPSSNSWSASSDIGNSGNSWFVYFSSGNYGISSYEATSTTNPVRCVRSCYLLRPTSRYSIGTGTVTDNVTGLIWQKVSPGGNTHSGAAGYCGGLNLGGFGSGWRLPTVKELQTLVDYSVNQGSLMMNSLFMGEPMFWFWSSTLLAGTSSQAWYVTFGDGTPYATTSLANNPYVRCVR